MNTNIIDVSSTPTVTALIPTPGGLSNVSQVRVDLTPAQQQRVKEILTQKSVEAMQPQEVALFGSERQQALSRALDELLKQITKGSSPVLFQLFKDLKDAGGKADVGKLEADIRKSLQTSWFQSMLDTLHLDNVASRVARVNKKIGDSLVSKTTSLLDVMKKMEGGVNDELQKLVNDAMKLDTLAREFILNSEEFGVSVVAGRSMLVVANTRALALKNEATTSGDMQKTQTFKDFDSKVRSFESRLLLLETAYVKSFSNLDAVSFAKTASITTIAETANSVLSEFTDIKTSLVTLSVSYQIQTAQAMNAARRELRATLEKHGSAVLNNVAVTAAKMQGDNRLEDATLLSALVTNLKKIGDEVEQEHTNNQQKFSEARTKLVEAQKTLTTISAPMPVGQLKIV